MIFCLPDGVTGDKKAFPDFKNIIEPFFQDFSPVLSEDVITTSYLTFIVALSQDST